MQLQLDGADPGLKGASRSPKAKTGNLLSSPEPKLPGQARAARRPLNSDARPRIRNLFRLVGYAVRFATFVLRCPDLLSL